MQENVSVNACLDLRHTFLMLIRESLFISLDSVMSVDSGKLKANRTQANIKLASVAVLISLFTIVEVGSKLKNVANPLNSTQCMVVRKFTVDK